MFWAALFAVPCYPDIASRPSVPPDLIDGLEFLLAGKAHDADWIVENLSRCGAKAVISSR